MKHIALSERMYIPFKTMIYLDANKNQKKIRIIDLKEFEEIMPSQPKIKISRVLSLIEENEPPKIAFILYPAIDSVEFYSLLGKIIDIFGVENIHNLQIFKIGGKWEISIKDDVELRFTSYKPPRPQPSGRP